MICNMHPFTNIIICITIEIENNINTEMFMNKKYRLTAMPLSLLMAFLFIFCGACTVIESNPDKGGEEEKPMQAEKVVNPLSFDDISETDDLKKFITEVDNADGSHNNDAKETGTIISPYFLMEAEGKAVDCYAVRTSLGAHSFAMIDVGAQSFPIAVTVDLLYGAEYVNVLPQKYEVAAVTDKTGKATAEIPGYGNYTFVADDNKETALTLIVREAEQYVVPEGYEEIRVEAGNHTEKLTFTAEKQVLYFEKGTHYLKYNIEFKNNTQVYLEEGCYIYATMPDRTETPMLDPAWSGKTRWNALFWGKGVKNVKIYGRGIVDLSKLDWHARSAIMFESCQEVQVEGITLNNSPEWTIYFMGCRDITVREILLFGYRQNSDGICIADGADALVENCFARSGDDLFEVKSMDGNCNIEIENIIFRRCNGWPDKARGMGIIYESVRDITDVRFEDCSIGYASAVWQDELGSLVVILGGGAKVTNIVFEDIEIYSSALYPVNVTLYDIASAQIDGIYFKNLDIRGDKSVRVANNSAVGGTIENLYFEGCMRNGILIEGYARLALKLTDVDKTKIYID